ncbi:MAG: hypothetical protein HN964_04100 [Candidatus Jacksonbacteria bacterium]|nr:hypothetical protein [Candidatus Jacksonbacteria bacterium]MBT6757358.1 hypothetical protein [Candidatus Jacksonbacteria bacterium]MBT7008608.1 hypothetical protein [Candidatus Jacksonbacteria bacterium]
METTRDGSVIRLGGLRIVVAYEYPEDDEGVSIKVFHPDGSCLLHFTCFGSNPTLIVLPSNEVEITESVRCPVTWAVEQLERNLVRWLSFAGYHDGIPPKEIETATKETKAAIAEVSQRTELAATG